MSGLAEYVNYFPCPYPESVETWDAITDAQVAMFTPDGFTRADCFTGLGDVASIGGVALTAPGGFFSTGDITQWGIGEWGAMAAGVYFLVSAVQDTKRVAGRVSSRARKISSRARKIKKGFS